VHPASDAEASHGLPTEVGCLLLISRHLLGGGWPSGMMSDCNAKGREFKSWWGKNSLNLQEDFEIYSDNSLVICKFI